MGGPTEPVGNFYEFIWVNLMKIMRRENLNGLRKCSGEGQSHNVSYALDSEEETREGHRKPAGGREKAGSCP